MRLPMRHLLASSAVAGLLFLLPAGGANAQGNRSTSWGWGAAGGVLTFIAGGAVGGIAGWRLSKLASKSKRDDDTMELTLTQLNSSVKVLDEKLTKLEIENIQRLSPTLESKPDSESAVNMGDHEKLPLPRIKEDSLAWVDQELMEIEGKVCDMEKRIQSIPRDELMSTEDVIRHLSNVDTKDDVEKVMYITGISDLKMQSYILANVSIAKYWLQNTREVLNTHKLGKANQKQVKIYDTDNVNRNPNMPDQDHGLDPPNPWEISKG